MKNEWLRKLVPHLIAVALFVIVALLFCKPVMNGYVLNQHDIVGWKGAAQNAFDVKAQTGTMPLWNTNVFSGMPNYQIALGGKSVLPNITKIFSVGLPNPANFFFIASICFYILCLSMGFKPVLAMAGALAFSFSTYNPVIIGAGHETKMYAIAFMPLLLAGLLLIFNRRYWIGLAVATLGAYQELISNHPQINYYFFIIAGCIAVGYFIQWIKQKDFKHLVLAMGLSAMAALVGLGAYYYSFATTKEYAEYTMRGGKSVEVKGDQVTAANTKGLDEDYAFSYSMRTAEPLVLFMPNAYGGSSGTPLKESTREKLVTQLTDLGIPQLNPMVATQIVEGLPGYWGGMTKPGEVGTAGPPYVGVIVFLLAIIGFVMVDHRLKWPLLIATAFGIILSWGSYFPGVNLFLLHNLPLYNKFRAPSMALVITQLTLPLMAVITLYYLFFKENSQSFLETHFKQILYTLGGVVVFTGLVYLTQSYASGFDQQLLNSEYPEPIKNILISGAKSERQSMFGTQILRTLLFGVLLLGILYLYLKRAIKPVASIVLVGLIVFVDLWVVGKKYLTDENYVPKEEVAASTFVKSAADEQILQDKDPHFRVFDVASGFNSNNASYFHRSVMGYHPAKLRIYQDIIERYFSTGQPPHELLNALDTRYIITQNQQGQVGVMNNPEAYGAAWFVKGLKPAADPVQELQALGNTHLKDTAIVPVAAMGSMGNIQVDSSATLKVTKYTNDEIEYQAQSVATQFAVFSEVYYPAGWTAYIDNKETPIIKTNYFMRGLVVPAGNHTIKFVFAPETAKRAMTISYISSILVALLVLGGFFMQWYLDRNKKNKPTN